MKEKQLSNRIENIDDHLIQQAEQVPNYARQHRRNGWRRMVSFAAVVALMVCSGIVGAVAFSKETIVEIPIATEMIDVGDSGISLVLPDSWAGKYGYDIFDNGDIEVYCLSARDEEAMLDGVLFWVECNEGQYPLDYVYAQPGYTIATTNSHTYRIVFASDVRYNSQDNDVASEYNTLLDSVPEIRILLSDWLTNNSINSSNWKESTVYVQLLGETGEDGQDVVKTIVLDEADSAAITQTIRSQDFTVENASFPVDLVIMLDGEAYHVNSLTGQINGVGGFSAVLSTEDLQIVIGIIGKE